MNASDFCARLNAIIPSDDGAHLQTLEELTASSTELAGNPAIATTVLAFLEQNGAADLGSPGPLVHYLESSFPSYVEALVASLSRHPVGYTLWMANRILNAQIPQQMRATLLQSLGLVAENPHTSETERRQAREFIERHTNAG